MAMYKTFIGDPLGCIPQALFHRIQIELSSLFFPCIALKFGDGFENSWVYKASPTVIPMGWELLVYFSPANVSIIKNVPGAPSLDLTIGGNTISTAGASEVYMKTNDPVMLARLAFHELMHNRLKMGGTGPHDGLHSLGGLASWIIDVNTEYTDSNKWAMNKVIKKPIKQWTDGLRINPLDPQSEYWDPSLPSNYNYGDNSSGGGSMTQ